MLLHIFIYDKLPFPFAPYPSLIAHLDISKENMLGYGQRQAKIKQINKIKTWRTWQGNKMLTSNIHLPSNQNLTKPRS